MHFAHIESRAKPRATEKNSTFRSIGTSGQVGKTLPRHGVPDVPSSLQEMSFSVVSNLLRGTLTWADHELRER
jgi:hypothetical protein